MLKKIPEGCIDIGVPPLPEAVDKDVALYRLVDPRFEQYGTLQNMLAKSGSSWSDAHQYDKHGNDPAEASRGDVVQYHIKHITSDYRVKVKPGEQWDDRIGIGKMVMKEPEQARDKVTSIRRKKK